MMTVMVKKQNTLHPAYSWNMLSLVRPYSVTTAIIADSCEFTGRLGQLEPVGRLHCKDFIH